MYGGIFRKSNFQLGYDKGGVPKYLTIDLIEL